MSTIDHPALGQYTSLADLSRMHYGRLLWKNPRTRARLMQHWTDPRHPGAERFISRYRPLVERVLESTESDDLVLDAELRKEGHSLRTIVREIPPVFGSFFGR